jgi:predicted amidophosphoribosyltransferase
MSVDPEQTWCPNCDHLWPPDYEYCPHCSEELQDESDRDKQDEDDDSV